MVSALGAFRELGHTSLVAPGVIGVALAAFRKLGWRWYMKVLLRDSVRFMKEQHEVDWSSKPRVAKEESTDLGRDQEAIIGILWHATQMDWFEYPAGSKVVYFHFPKTYRKAARDGVPIFFEKPGPGTKDGSQPRIADPVMRERTQEKVSKVLQR
jgi:hypothetical protein